MPFGPEFGCPGRTLVVHAGCADPAAHPRVGFVVSKAVGSAVRRNRVKRRLRHLAGEQLRHTPAGVDVVVRALPRSASEPARLPSDFSAAWSAAVSRLDCP